MAIQHSNNSSSLGDLLERILDKGIVIAGDIKISLADVELLNIKIRLLVASVDKAKEMGIDWWAHDPYLSSRARAQEPAALEAVAPAQIALQDEESVGNPAEVLENDATIKRPRYRT
ncbi:gas vesicle protein [Desulfosporosinus sp. FKA]|uniref:gas vesicle protein n=1 Tax=Desulfosporosinus sp. FKA TaxID=1969834 RepID=UPI000B49834A|nr:gas vesicle protein [Desulfosporosinus sp. FKA]